MALLRISAPTILVVVLAFLLLPMAVAQSLPVKNIQIVWLKTHHYVLNLSPGTSYTFGDVLILDDTNVHKHPARCFDDVPKSKWDEYTVFEERHEVWKRSKIKAVIDMIGAVSIKLSESAKEAGKVVPDVELTLKPSKGAANISAVVSFRGTREEVSSQVLLGHVLKSQWQNDCLSAVKSNESFVILDIIRGSLRIRFAQEIDGKPKPIDYVLPSEWKRVGVEGEETGEFEREATLIVARHLKTKSNGSRVTWMKLTTYLSHL